METNGGSMQSTASFQQTVSTPEGLEGAFVIDKDSKVSFFEMGGSDKIGEHLKKAIDSVLK
ncbi:hypothetical protein [Sphingobacterium lumbrici]|uniref:hypothetical protein n=1 Tax=Sphingobacterium lumbrici TaxID=2559600 RepID=UPI001C10B7A9|nr:hypothetical protein [Sphingobacterium lumbrici]